jgi:hypothetical protein
MRRPDQGLPEMLRIGFCTQTRAVSAGTGVSGSLSFHEVLVIFSLKAAGVW